MSTEFFNDQWRIPSNENQNKVSNYSMEFDGTNDKIDFGDVNGFDITDKFSGSCWIYPTAVGSDYILGKEQSLSPFKGYMLYIDSNRKLRFIMAVQYSTIYFGVASSSAIPYNTWTHLAFTYDGSTNRTGLKLYINSVLQTVSYTGNSTISGSMLDSTVPFQISGRGGSATNGVNGKIDQVCIFDYALSQDQVTQLGAEGYAFNFNGSSQFVNISNPTQLTDDFTIAAWIYPTRVNDSYEMIYTQGDGTVPAYFAVQDTKLHVYITGVYQTNLGFINANEWQHVAVTRTSGVLNLYKNGVEYNGNRPTQNGTINNNSDGVIGKWYNSSHYFKGEISNVQTFNTALPATGSDSIVTLYNSGKPLPDMSSFTSLQGWWKLDKTATFNSGTSVWSIPDASTNSNNGTSVGMDASNLVASNINGELIANPMITSPKPIAYYQLGDQSVDNGANYLVPNNSLQDYVFNFDGSNDYIDCGNGSTMARGQEITYSVWANLVTFSADIIGNKSSSNFGTGLNFAAGNLVFQLGNGSNDSWSNSRINLSSYVNTGEWFHIIGTFDGTNAKIYINGIERNNWTPTQPFTISGWNNNFQIGKRADQVSSFINGRLSNVAFWNSGLTPTQVTTLYNNGSPAADISSLNPIAWYKLNASEVFNSTSTEWSIDNNAYPSVYKSSLNFDGNNDYIDCGDSNTFTFGNGTTDSPFSISAWINMDDATQFRIASKAGSNGNEYFLTNGGDDKLNFILYDTDSGGAGDIRAKYDTALTSYQGQWIHVVGTYSGVNKQNGLELYLNGNPLTTLKVLNTPYTAMNNTTQPFEIGRSASSSYSNGKVSNVSVFNTELTSTQVETLYNNGTPEVSISHSPVSWWKLDNTTTGLIDNGSASNNGTNNGATEYAGFVNSIAGESSGMDSSNLVQSNLQHTSGYSPYALSLDGSNDYFPLGSGSSLNFTGDLSISFWIKTTDTRSSPSLAGKWGGVGFRNWTISHNNGIVSFAVSSTGTTAGNGSITGNTIVNDGNWHHVLVVNDSTTTNNYIYIDGYQDATANVGRSIVGTATPTFIGINAVATGLRYSGDMSNFAFWNTVVTPEQVNEIYNQGVPTNLNNFSGATPLHWWQLGSNSSFNAGSWTCLDETGTLNAVSNPAMTEDDITNGPGYSANGLGTSSIEIVGDAPYSTANGLSENMDVLDRTTDVPS
jgi:hypothetical protein